ncbi:MAG: MerR family transcriptional regulator [Micromonosporaceae bacterium]
MTALRAQGQYLGAPMKMAELSRTTGVPVATIKYYLREGLLAHGRRTSPNQADYDESHVRRLRVIRSLVEVAQLPISTIGELLHQIDAPDVKLHMSFGLAQSSVTTQLTAGEADHRATAARMLEELMTRRGWQVHPENPAHDGVISVLATYLALGDDDLAAAVDRYADAAEIIADVDVRTIAERTDPGRQIEGVVIGTLLGDPLIAALRRLAQENVSARLFTPACAEAGSVDAEGLPGGGDQQQPGDQ